MTRLDYCQFLLSNQVNYTLTYFADHSHKYVHDRINRYLRDSQLKPSLVYEQVRSELVADSDGYLVFDDTVLDKNYSFKIEAVRRQWSGNTHSVIKGIGVVSCVYVNWKTSQYWIVDFRIYNPDTNQKSKNDHVAHMLTHTLLHKKLPTGQALPFSTVLFDSWYASKALMLAVDNANKLFYCPLKSNRGVCEDPP